MGTYKVRNETKSTKTKRNQQKRNETKRNEINEIKRNQRNRKWKKNNRGLKEIKLIFTITMLDYFPHMSVFHQERTGFYHH